MFCTSDKVQLQGFIFDYPEPQSALRTLYTLVRIFLCDHPL
jgi:hypothetical protein